MGHDVYAYKSSDSKKAIAHMRRGSMDQYNEEIYKALDSMDCKKGNSGNGEKRMFTSNQLYLAQRKIGTSPLVEEERAFIKKCIANVGDDDKITLLFS